MIAGKKVIYTGNVSKGQINWGGNTDPRGILIPGEEYVLDRIEEHSWHTRVYLQGIEDAYFNSVWFEEVINEKSI